MSGTVSLPMTYAAAAASTIAPLVKSLTLISLKASGPPASVIRRIMQAMPQVADSLPLRSTRWVAVRWYTSIYIPHTLHPSRAPDGAARNRIAVKMTPNSEIALFFMIPPCSFFN